MHRDIRPPGIKASILADQNYIKLKAQGQLNFRELLVFHTPFV